MSNFDSHCEASGWVYCVHSRSRHDDTHTDFSSVKLEILDIKWPEVVRFAPLKEKSA